MAEDEEPLPIGLRLGLALASALLTFGLAEGLIRLVDGGALPHLRGFVVEDGQIHLAADLSTTLRRADGGTFTLHTTAQGLRASGELPAHAPLFVGDSQVLGMGVDDEETAAARFGAHNAGVPGHGVEDALARAERLLPLLDPQGVYLFVNQANDWEDGLRPLADRMAVAGGWLIAPDRAQSPTGRLFWGSPLSRSHVLYLAQLLLRGPAPAAEIPAWMADPAAQQPTSAAIAARIQAFSAAHPENPLHVVFLPVDVAANPARVDRSPFGPAAAQTQPWANHALRDQLAAALAPLPLLDLTPILAGDADLFLPADYHLSVAGQAQVAQALRTAQDAP